MQSQLDSSRYARSILSNSTRREVLWNVLEPGDPYDIKKSMIAKLPGDRKIFMGDHLDMVCLLQAAEIERLCEFLDDYKLKFREIERSNLDRHSYEVQIKQLTQKLAEQESCRTENSKLKEFIKRQGTEIEALQKSSRDTRQFDENYKSLYEKSLEKVNSLLGENRDARQQSEEYRLQLQTYAARFEALEKAKNKQIQELKLNYAQFSRESYESSLNSVRLQLDGEIKRLEFELKRQRQVVDAKNQEISELYRRNEAFSQELSQYRDRGDNHYVLERQIVEYENKFVVFGQEIERLNIALRDCTTKLEEAQLRRREDERRIEKYEFEAREAEVKSRTSIGEIAHLKDIIKRLEIESTKVTEVQQLRLQYETRITEQARDNEQLSTKLRYELENSKKLREEIDRLTFELSRRSISEKEMSELKEANSELTLLRRRVAEYENKSNILNKQIERLNFQIKNRETQLEKSRSVIYENETLRSKIKEVEYSVVNKYESELSRIKTDYEQKLDYLNRTKGSEFQSKAQLFEAESEKLRTLLREKNEESDKQRAKIYELEVLLNRLELESNTKIKNYEINFANLKRENEELLSKVRVLSENQRKLYEFQSKTGQYERELQRLSNNLKVKDEEVITLRSRVRETEGLNQKYEMDVSRKITGYQQNINQVKADNEELRKRLNELINESNRRLQEAAQEIERLGNAIKARQEEKLQLENRIRQLTQQNETTKNNLSRLASENDELRRRLIESENKINSLVNENIRSVTNENQNLKRQLTESKNSISAYEIQVNKRFTIFEQNINNIGRENEDLKRRLTEYESRLALLSQEFERINLKLKSRNEEFAVLEGNYKSLVTEYENTKRSFKEYEISVTRQFEGEISRKITNFEQNIQTITRENQDLKRRLNDFEGRYKQAGQEIEALRRQIAQKDTQVSGFQVQVNKKISLYENNVLNLTHLNEELQRKLTDTDQLYKQRTDQLRALAQENETNKRKFKEYELSVNQMMEGEVNRRYAMYEQSIAKLNQDNEDLRRKIQDLGGDLSRKLSESQLKFTQLTQEYERLKLALNNSNQENETLRRKIEEYNISISNYEAEVNRRMTAYEQNISTLNRENEQLRRKLQEAGDLARRLAEYENRIALLSQELERITTSLNQSRQENEGLKRQLNDQKNSIGTYELEVSRKVTTYEQNITLIQRDNEQYKRRNAEYEQRLVGLSQELERVNNAYRSKNDQLSRLDINFKNLALQNEQLRKQQRDTELMITNKYEIEVKNKFNAYEQNLAAFAKENEELKRRLQEMENRLALASQEIERLTQNLKNKQEDLSKADVKIRNQLNEIDGLKRQFSELQAKFAHTYQFEVTKKYNAYEQQISELKRINGQSSNKYTGATQQIERLNNILRLKVEESNQLTLTIKNQSAQYEEYLRKVRENQINFGQNINIAKKENEDLRRKVQQLQNAIRQQAAESDRRLAEYENKFKVIGQQVQRLNLLLRTRNQQFERMTRQIKEFELTVNQNNQKVQAEVKNKYNQYENALNIINRENEEFKRRLNDAGDLGKRIAEYENKLVLAAQEMERLNLILKNKNDEIARLTQISRRIPEYQSKISQIFQENEKLQLALRNKTDELSNAEIKLRQLSQDNQNLRRGIKELENNWSNKYEMEVSRKVVTYEQNLGQLSREKEQWLRKRTEYESKITMLSQQLERTNGMLRTKSEEYQRIYAELQNIKKISQQKIQITEAEYATLQKNYTIVSQEYDNAKKHLQEYEVSIRKLYSEFERLQGIINELKKERQSLFDKNHVLSEEINRLTAENKDLEEQTRDIRLRLCDQNALQKRINEHLGLMVVLFAEIETLRQRVKDKEKEVEVVRRSSLAPNIL